MKDFKKEIDVIKEQRDNLMLDLKKFKLKVEEN